MSAQDIINELAPQYTETDADFEAVEARINTAQYYKLILNNSLFDNDSSDAALMVEHEIREFVKTRIKVLLGLEQPKAEVVEREPDFTPEEVEALKELAYRLRTTRITVNEPSQQETRDQPPVSQPIAERKRPGPKPGMIRKPALRKAPVPMDLKGSSKPAITAKLIPQPTQPPVIDPNNDPEKFNPLTNAKRKRQDGRLLEQIIDPRNGKVKTSEDGQEMWADVTPAPKPGPGYIPPPTQQVLSQQLEAMANNQAMGLTSAVGVVSGSSGLVGAELAGIVDLMRNS